MAIRIQYGRGPLLKLIARDQTMRNAERERMMQLRERSAGTDDYIARRRMDQAELEANMRQQQADADRAASMEALQMRLGAAQGGAEQPYDNYSNKVVLPDGRVLSGPQAAVSPEAQAFKKAQAKQLQLISNNDSLSSAEKKIAEQMLNQRHIAEQTEEDTRPLAVKQKEFGDNLQSRIWKDDEGRMWTEDQNGVPKVVAEPERDRDSGGGSMSPTTLRNYRRDARDEIMAERGASFIDGEWIDANDNLVPLPTQEELIAKAREIKQVDAAINATDEQLMDMPKEEFDKVTQDRKLVEDLVARGATEEEAKYLLRKPKGITDAQVRLPIVGTLPMPPPGDLLGEYSQEPAVEPQNAQPQQAAIPQNQPNMGMAQPAVPGQNPIGADGHPIDLYTPQESDAISTAYAKSPDKGAVASAGVGMWKMGSGAMPEVEIESMPEFPEGKSKGRIPQAEDVVKNKLVARQLKVKLSQLEREEAPQEAVDLAILDAIKIDQNIATKSQRDIDKAWAFGFIQSFTNATDGYNRELAKEYVADRWGSYEKGMDKVWKLGGEFISEMYKDAEKMGRGVRSSIQDTIYGVDQSVRDLMNTDITGDLQDASRL